MKLLLIFYILIFSQLTYASNPEKYSRVKIAIDKTEMSRVAACGISIEGAIWKENALIVEISESAILALQKTNIHYDILIDDMTRYYVERNNSDTKDKSANQTLTTLSTKCYFQRNKLNAANPQNYSLGTMGGYHTYSQINTWLSTMHNLYPNLISDQIPIDTTKTIERRPLTYVKIASTKKNIKKPKILYTALIHAREPIGMEQLLYYMAYLLENYGKNEFVTQVIDNTDLYFIPCINPDGYAYNCTNSPSGGGMNRKNRKKNSDGTYGIDLNRNFGYNWGYDNSGSSPSPDADNYRGTAAFSEPETSVFRKFCNETNFNIVLNYHAYGNFLIRPWGYASNVYPVDSVLYRNLSEVMTADNKYFKGNIYQALSYISNGGSDDWLYGATSEHPKIFGFTPEVGMETDGFWPASSRIIPLCRENVLANLKAALLAGSYAELKDISNNLLTSATGFIPFNLYNTGTTTPSKFTVRMHILGTDTASDSRKTFANCVANQTIKDSLPYSITNAIPGNIYSFVFSISSETWTLTDTVTKTYGAIKELFTDNGTSLNKWATTSWGVYQNNCITDVPNGIDKYNSNALLTTKDTIDLSNSISAQLTFSTKWNMHVQTYYVQVQVSADGGQNWEPICGRYTSRGYTNQSEELPIYDGIQTDYVNEYFDLSAFCGNKILLRFLSSSSGGNHWFYFKDISVKSIEKNTTEIMSLTSNNSQITVRPNPCFSEVTIGSNLENIKSICLFNSIGSEISAYTNINERNITINTESLKIGLYIYRITLNSGATVYGKLMKN